MVVGLQVFYLNAAAELFQVQMNIPTNLMMSIALSVRESNKTMHADNLRGVEIAMSLRSILPQLRHRINYG